MCSTLHSFTVSVAQWIRASVSGTEGRRFESCRGRVVMSRVIVDTMSCDIVDKPASWFLFSKAPVVVFRSVGCAVLEGLFLWLNGTRKQHPADLATARKKVHGL